MTERDQMFDGSIPELYDTYLVPLIFESYANDLADRVATLKPKRVLETAAGSGVVTRALASRLASDAFYTVTDLNQAMLDYAASKDWITASHGVRPTLWTCPSMMTHSMPSYVNLASCSFQTESPVMPRRGGYSNRVAASSLMSGILSKRTSSPISSQKWRLRYSPMTRRFFLPEPRTAIMMWS